MHSEASPEVVRWSDRSEVEFLRPSEKQGLPADNMEKLEGFGEEQFNKLKTLVEPRSEIWQCYKDGDCDDYTYKDNFYEATFKAIPEAMLTNASTITDLAEKSEELATVTCNNNGFYELGPS